MSISMHHLRHKKQEKNPLPPSLGVRGDNMGNFESLAMVLLDKSYNGKEFIINQFYFAEDLLKEENKDETIIKECLKQQKEIVITIDKKECGSKVMIIYIDIYGNEFKEALSVPGR